MGRCRGRKEEVYEGYLFGERVCVVETVVCCRAGSGFAKAISSRRRGNKSFLVRHWKEISTRQGMLDQRGQAPDSLCYSTRKILHENII